MGKEGLRLVLLAFNNKGIKKENAPKVAEYYLQNYRFIYQDPEDDEVSFITLIPIIFFPDSHASGE